MDYPGLGWVKRVCSGTMLETIFPLLGRLLIVLLGAFGAWLCAMALGDMMRLRRNTHRRANREERQEPASSFWFRVVAMLAAIAVFAAMVTAAIISMFCR